MKRKITFYTIILTAFLLCGCTTANAQGSKSPNGNTATETPAGTEASQSTEQSQNTSNTQNAVGTQDTAQMQNDATNQGSEQTQGNNVQSNNAQETMITEDNATTIALSHAGITSEEITFIQCELDSDDGKQYYNVEFYTKDQKDYDYEIDPYTGEIIEWDVEPIHDIK